MNRREEIISRLKPGTKFIELEPCKECKGTLYYERADGSRRHNGCIGCAQAKEVISAKGSALPFKSVMTDENGVPIYNGTRGCKVCKTDKNDTFRIGVSAYSSKVSTCLICAINYHNEKHHGKEIRKFSNQVKRHTHKFIVSNIDRSETIEVAPFNLIEYLELRDLIERKDLMNLQEKSLGTGIVWEICHKFPASGGGTEYRGKATVNNLVIAMFEVNRKEGDTLPESWDLKQVVKIDEFRKIQTSSGAAKAWKDRKENIFERLSKEKKAELEIKEREAQENHKKLVKGITNNFMETISLIDKLPVISFHEYMSKLQYDSERIRNQMEKIIDASIQRGETRNYIKTKNQRILVDAFYDGRLRSNIILQTFQQIADAEMIIKEQEHTPETIEQLETVKRCAVIWAKEIAENPKQKIVGFTHPLLNVVSNPYVWGTIPDENGNQWLCVWNKPTIDDITNGIKKDVSPLDIHNPKLYVEPPATVNSIFWGEETTPVKNWKTDGWRSTDADYFYEREAERRKRVAIEEKRKAAEEERRAKNSELIAIAWANLGEVKATVNRVADKLEIYAKETLMEHRQTEAMQRIQALRDKAENKEVMLVEITSNETIEPEALERQLRIWSMKPIDEGFLVFRDLL